MDNSYSKQFKLRTEVLEFGTLPIILKISSNQLVKSFSEYLRDDDSRISFPEINKILCSMIANFTDKDVQLLYILYKVVVDNEIDFLVKVIQKGDWKNRFVDAKKFCLFMILQNYRTNLDSSNSTLSHQQFNESFRGNSQNNFSPLNSPRRGMNMRSQGQSESQQLKSFLRSNIPLLLWIVSGAKHPLNPDKPFPVATHHFDLLSPVFQVLGSQSQPLSSRITRRSDLNSKSLRGILDSYSTIKDGKLFLL